MNKKDIKLAVDKLKDVLAQELGRNIKIILFGSAARGEYNSESDIDILVLIPGIVNNRLEEQIFNIAYDIELSMDVVFGIIVYSVDFWNSDFAGVMPLYNNIEREGIVV
jgi:predicted nucleotidyltransferase